MKNKKKSKLLYGVLCTINNDVVSFAINQTSTINKLIHCFLFALNDIEKHEYILDVVWFSCSTRRWLRVNYKITLTNKIEMVVLGICQNTYVSIWGVSENKSYLIAIIRGEDVNNIVESLISPDDTPSFEWSEISCDNYTIQQQLQYPQILKQYVYRYCVNFEIRNNIDIMMQKNVTTSDYIFNHIEEMLFDGTHDKLHDGGLMKYHQAGKPKKLRVEWHIGKSEYSAYFWFEDARIREVFDRFYGAHPDTKTDFIIRIDAEKRKYELALYRYGLKEPQVIPEDVYQLLVFKNKFEDYRSDNYNQERGAWIW